MKKSLHFNQHPLVITAHLHKFFISGNVKETGKRQKGIFRYLIQNIDTTNSNAIKGSNLEIVL